MLEVMKSRRKQDVKFHTTANNQSYFYDLMDAETGQTVKVPISPEIFMSQDGDWAQIEVLIDQILPKFTVANVECYKYPGGCSLLFQPNDNMHSHAILHKLFEASSTKHKNDRDFVHIPDPAYLQIVEQVLRTEGLIGVTLDKYVNFYRWSAVYFIFWNF